MSKILSILFMVIMVFLLMVGGGCQTSGEYPKAPEKDEDFRY